MAKPTAKKLNFIERGLVKMIGAGYSSVAGMQAALRHYQSGGVVSRAGSRSGTLSNWAVKRLSRFTEASERTTITDRAEDLVASDPHAASVVDSMAVNIVGTGLVPQSNPHERILGWTEEQSKEFKMQAEYCFDLWARKEECDTRGRLPFWAKQYLSMYSMLVKGEFLHIPTMIDEPGRSFSLALDTVAPARLFTPSDMTGNANLRDGVQLGERGNPLFYWFANPSSRQFHNNRLASDEFQAVPFRVGHRPGVLHGFVAKDEEQVRGHSILRPAMKFFRDLTDCLDFELVGAIIQASFPIFIETQNPSEMLGRGLDGQALSTNDSGQTYSEVNPGQVLYGKPGQSAKVLEGNRPGTTFDSFVERMLRAVGASVGMPYEVIAKDFSKTNYSSARAALLEAWRLFCFYQRWLVGGFCQPCWDMVIEEAWLRGMLTLPKGTPDFYLVRHALTRCNWIPPKKGHIDPLKEVNAQVKALDADITTLADVILEQGGGDWEDKLEQRNRERRLQTIKGDTNAAPDA